MEAMDGAFFASVPPKADAVAHPATKVGGGMRVTQRKKGRVAESQAEPATMPNDKLSDAVPLVQTPMHSPFEPLCVRIPCAECDPQLLTPLHFR